MRIEHVLDLQDLLYESVKGKIGQWHKLFIRTKQILEVTHDQ